MLLLDEWGICRDFGCSEKAPKVLLLDRFYARQRLQRFKQDFSKMATLRRLLMQERMGWDLSGFPDDTVIDQITELLVSGRFHVHVETVTTVGRAAMESEGSSPPTESRPAFPLSERRPSRATETSHKPVEASADPPTFSADTDFAAQAATLVAAAPTGAAAWYTKLKPISQAQADAVFKKMAASADKIPFDYPNDCCYSRAHEMCRMMKDQGIDCGKVWNYANPGPPKGHSPPGPPLAVNTPNSPSGQVTWRYHVAPIVDVRGSDGVVRTMVLDPSMFDHPVTVDEWRTAQYAPNAITQFDEHFDPNSAPYYRYIDGANAEYDTHYSQTHEQLRIHQIDRDSQDPAFVAELEKRRQERVKESLR